jgi:hypothetical protein
LSSGVIIQSGLPNRLMTSTRESPTFNFATFRVSVVSESVALLESLQAHLFNKKQRIKRIRITHPHPFFSSAVMGFVGTLEGGMIPAGSCLLAGFVS